MKTDRSNNSSSNTSNSNSNSSSNSSSNTSNSSSNTSNSSSNTSNSSSSSSNTSNSSSNRRRERASQRLGPPLLVTPPCVAVITTGMSKFLAAVTMLVRACQKFNTGEGISCGRSIPALAVDVMSALSCFD